jgi:hypothetical protein
LAVIIGQFEAWTEFGLFQGGEGCGDLVSHMDSVFGAAGLCAMGNIANDNRMFSEGCWNGRYPFTYLENYLFEFLSNLQSAIWKYGRFGRIQYVEALLFRKLSIDWQAIWKKRWAR